MRLVVMTLLIRKASGVDLARCLLFLVSVLLSRTAVGETIAPKFASDIPYSKITFEVYDAVSKELISTGEEFIEFDGKTIKKETKYFSTDQSRRLLQSEYCEFDDSSLRIHSYKMSNEATGESVGMTMAPSGNETVSTYKSNAKSKSEEFRYSWTDQSVVGKTLHHITVRRWRDIINDDPAKFELFVPMRRDHFAFRLRKEKSYVKDKSTYYVLSLEPQNWALRRLVPQMDFHYRDVDGVPRLEHYEGVTTVTVNGKEDRKVSIEFHYEKVSECPTCTLAH